MENFEKVVYLQGNGKLVKEEIRDQISDEFLRKVYRQLTLMRTFDRKAINLQRQGRLGTYAPFEGQEASQVGSALALQNDDWIFPTYRDHAATMTFGLPLETVLLYWNGRAEGCIPPSGKEFSLLLFRSQLSFPMLQVRRWLNNTKGRTMPLLYTSGTVLRQKEIFMKG